MLNFHFDKMEEGFHVIQNGLNRLSEPVDETQQVITVEKISFTKGTQHGQELTCGILTPECPKLDGHEHVFFSSVINCNPLLTNLHRAEAHGVHLFPVREHW